MEPFIIHAPFDINWTYIHEGEKLSTFWTAGLNFITAMKFLFSMSGTPSTLTPLFLMWARALAGQRQNCWWSSISTKETEQGYTPHLCRQTVVFFRNHILTSVRLYGLILHVSKILFL
jgi:hypothetical protein